MLEYYEKVVVGMKLNLNDMKTKPKGSSNSLVCFNVENLEARVKEELALLKDSEVAVSKEKLELIYFFDASPSVEGTEKEMANKFYSQITQLRERKDIIVSLIVFDGKDHVLHYRQNGKDIKHTTYSIGMGTALYDTLTKYLLKIKDEQIKSKQSSHKTIVTIMTDGGNNCFYQYRLPDLNAAIRDCKALGWEFVFIAADKRSYEANKMIEIKKENMILYDYRLSLDEAFRIVYGAISEYDENGSLSGGWHKRLALPDYGEHHE